MKKRRWARFVAAVRRKFFTTCPRCGGGFGGHEPHGVNVAFRGTERGHPTVYRIACQACTDEAKRDDYVDPQYG
jgi:hypothetical protein